MTPDIPDTDFAELSEVDEFVDLFESGLLPKASWTHRAHLAVGLWHLLRHGPERALTLLRERIQRHNDAVGTPNTNQSGYHETITRLYLLGINEFLANRPYQPLDSLTTYRDLLTSDLADPTWPLRYYTRERLFSVEARRAWTTPNLQAVPGGALA